MQEIKSTAGALLRRALSMIGFWTLAICSMALFALVVLSPAYCELLAVREKLAEQEARVEAQRQLAEQLGSVCDAMRDEPRYVAMAVRREMGYQRPGEEPLSIQPESYGVKVASVQPETPAQTAALVSLARQFSRPAIRPPALVAGAAMIIVAVLFFEVPTRESRNTDKLALSGMVVARKQ